MRNEEGQAAVLILLAVVLVAAPARSAAPPSAASPAPVPFVTVAAGQHSAIIAPLQTVIRDQAAWTALWRRHMGIASASPPPVDFERTMVIAIFAGRASASTIVKITRILAHPARLVVYYVQGERRPLPEQAQEAAPFHVARVLRSAMPVNFLRVKTPPVLAPGPSS